MRSFRARGNKNLVLLVTYSSLIGLFPSSIFTANSKFLSNQTGRGQVRTCYCEQSVPRTCLILEWD